MWSQSSKNTILGFIFFLEAEDNFEKYKALI